MRLRGQLITADVVVAIAAAALIAALVLNAVEFSLAASEKQAVLSSTLADSVAAGVAEGININISRSCTQSNATNSSCSRFSCAEGNVFAAQRIVPCEAGAGYCIVEVRTCE